MIRRGNARKMLCRNLGFCALVCFLCLGDRWDALSAMSSTQPKHFVGFDLGTSGVRISVVERTEEGSLAEVHSQAISWPNGVYDDADIWMESVESLLEQARESSALNKTLKHVKAICISGTSSSCILVDGKNTGKPSRPSARMYNFDVVSTVRDEGMDPIHGVRALEWIAQFAPEQHTARSATGSLAKLLSWHDEQPLQPGERLAHQSDYISLRLMSNDKACGSQRNERFVNSDWHNVLKLGYDVRNLEFPQWLVDCLDSVGLSAESVLPRKVVSPGEPMGTISPDVAKRLGLSDDTVIVGGTTDSNAAFLAATAMDSIVAPSTAVVSLGSTLAIKQVSTTYVEDASVGVYSHRYPSVLLPKGEESLEGEQRADEAWLVGGASNVGCAVLRQEAFSVDELQSLSNDIDPNTESPLSYYPLTRKGERFPVADSNKEPNLSPKVDDRKDYLHGILQGISDVEIDGFKALAKLGASPAKPGKIWTCGGGAQNDMWSEMRQRRLKEAFGNEYAEVAKAENVEASFGAAILAAASFPADASTGTENSVGASAKTAVES